MELVEKLPIQEQKKRTRIHPHKFALWIACASIVMMFAALTSAYVVRRAGGNWLEFGLPDVFYYNTAVIIASSVLLHISYVAFVKGNTTLYRSLLTVSTLLGITFVVLQYVGWETLAASGIGFKANPSSSFLYVISGLHALHVLAGIAALVIAMVFAFIRKHEVTPLKKLRFELVVHYWHFVDILWIYLFGFLLTQG
jgi:cytochrome c oxidase subunit III